MISLSAPTPMAPSLSLSFDELTQETEWIRAIDSDAVIYAENSAVYCDFHATLDEVQMALSDFTCLDLYLTDKWVCWDDCSELPHPAEPTQLRYILTA